LRSIKLYLRCKQSKKPVTVGLFVFVDNCSWIEGLSWMCFKT